MELWRILKVNAWSFLGTTIISLVVINNDILKLIIINNIKLKDQIMQSFIANKNRKGFDNKI